MRLKKINKYCTRIGNDLLYVDIVKTSEGNIRIGSMPEISKYLKKYNINYEYVVVPPPRVTTMGDNYTGEEFVIWNEIHSKIPKTRKYIGALKDLLYLMKRLHITIDQKFDQHNIQIVNSLRVPNLCQIVPLNVFNTVSIGKVEIIFSNFSIEIFDNYQLVYDSNEYKPLKNVCYETEKLFQNIKKLKPNSKNLKVLVLGNGNGFKYKTSNFLVAFGERIIWIDVGAYPFLTLAKYNIHPDSITDYIITHNHEDHFEGFTAILKRAIETNNYINLLTTTKIFNTLKAQLNYMFSNIEKYIHFINLTPKVPRPYFNGTITARINHHPIRQGTLGLKFEYNGSVFGLSGDTLYDEKLINKLKRKELKAEWFKECNLVFHEVEFKNPDTVHSYYKEVQKLKEKINGELFVYHTHIRKNYLPLAKEGCWYILTKNGIKIEECKTNV